MFLWQASIFRSGGRPRRPQGPRLPGPTRTVLGWALALALTVPSAVPAQPIHELEPREPAPPSPGCAGGLTNDDGTYESGVFTRTMLSRFEPPATEARFETICICWSRINGTLDIDYDVVVYAADGPGGEPGTELERISASAAGVTPERKFYEHDVAALGIELPTEPFYLGVDTGWNSSLAFVCTDLSGTDHTTYRLLPEGWDLLDDRTLMIRAGLDGGDSSPPPPGPPVVDSRYPDFRIWVRITGQGQASILGTWEPDCLDETVCFSGAVPGRSEVFARIVGPKPNGKLWPTLVKFTTSQVEVWIEQASTGQLRYYLLEGASPGADELPGLFDRDGFEP